MEIRSGGLPQSSTFSDVIGLLELIGDPKKSKKALEGLASDIADFQAAYQVNIAQLADVAKQKQELIDGFEKLNADSAILETKQNDYFRAVQSLDEQQIAFKEKEKALIKGAKDANKAHIEAMLKLESSQVAANKKFDDAVISLNKSDALIAEYEAKLSRLKEMVG